MASQRDGYKSAYRWVALSIEQQEAVGQLTRDGYCSVQRLGAVLVAVYARGDAGAHRPRTLRQEQG